MQLSGDERFYRLHDVLHDDIYRKTSPGTLCRRFGVSLLDLHELWRRHTLTLGMMLMENRLPAVMEGLSLFSMSREEACPRCDGIGSVREGDTRRECPRCEGVARVRVPGDPHSLRLWFEIMGLVGPKRRRSAWRF
jgi:hypothetical protein